MSFKHTPDTFLRTAIAGAAAEMLDLVGQIRAYDYLGERHKLARAVAEIGQENEKVTAALANYKRALASEQQVFTREEYEAPHSTAFTQDKQCGYDDLMSRPLAKAGGKHA
jgi:lipocalin